MVLLRYELGEYLLYASVGFEDGAPWHVENAKLASPEARYLASGVCKAVRAGDADVARMLVLSALLGREADVSA